MAKSVIGSEIRREGTPRPDLSPCLPGIGLIKTSVFAAFLLLVYTGVRNGSIPILKDEPAEITATEEPTDQSEDTTSPINDDAAQAAR
ncbi:hypothetical protein HOG48_00895 [Candidatus Peregrinibacteria bacterium]|jgi:hypothetical protein|nr:hypothetical protein [Candidatus Peregrinibacteria bacterium]